MSKLSWMVDWVLDDGKDALDADAARWRASVYRWVKIVLFSIAGVWLMNFLGNDAARRAASSFEGLATIVWVGDASSTRDMGTAYKGGAHGRIQTWQDGAEVLIDRLSEPVMHRANPNTLRNWLHAGDRVRVKYKRGTFLFWENINVIKLTTLTAS